MDKNVIGVFDDYSSAQTAVKELVDGGFPREKISLIRNDEKGKIDASPYS